MPAHQVIDDHAACGQMQPRGQSRGNQNIGACRVSTAHTCGGAAGFAAERFSAARLAPAAATRLPRLGAGR